MHSLKIQNGDLALAGDGNVVRVSGAERIKQELAAWLLPSIGSNVHHRGFGSTVHSFVGRPLDEGLLTEVKAEVNRVVQNYVAYQSRQIQESQQTSGTRNFVYVWNPSDIIASVDDILVAVSRDSVKVTVVLTTARGQQVRVAQQV